MMILTRQNKILIAVSTLVALLIGYAFFLKIDARNQAIALSEAQNAETNTTLMNWFDNQESHYRIRYPSQWERQEAGAGTVVFSGKIGSPSFYTTVNVQAILSKKTGGDYRSIADFMVDIKKQAHQQSKQVKFLKEGPIDLTDVAGKKIAGNYLLFTYEYKGMPFKQWQIVTFRNDQQVFYAWAFTAPLSQYDNDYPTAKAMLDSWTIY